MDIQPAEDAKKRTRGWAVVIASVWVAGATKLRVITSDGPLAPVNLLACVADVIPATL